MNFYIASSFSNSKTVQKVSEQLVRAGFIHTYDWTTNGRAKSMEDLKAIGTKERDGVGEADFVVILLPGGKGTHVELGMAISLKKNIYLYSSDEKMNEIETTSTFYHLSEVTQCIGTTDKLIQQICRDYPEITKKHTVY
jgi:nucleoside 2-deoxyribosyltransferase